MKVEICKRGNKGDAKRELRSQERNRRIKERNGRKRKTG
jgi:hypothetical protein